MVLKIHHIHLLQKNVGINGLNGDFSTELGDVFEGYNPQKAKEHFQLALKE